MTLNSLIWKSRRAVVTSPLAMIFLVTISCDPPADPVRVADVGLWAVDQAASGEVGAMLFGALELQFAEEETSSWGSGDAEHARPVTPPARGRYFASGAEAHGASRSISIDEDGLRYRSLYLVPNDALPCYALPGSAAAGRDVPNLALDIGGSLARVSCSWDEAGLRVLAEGEGPAALEWELGAGAYQESFITDWVGGSAKDARPWTGLSPSVGSARLVALTADDGILATWPASGQGRLLLLPPLLDAVDGASEYVDDPFADYHAALPVEIAADEVSVRYDKGADAMRYEIVLDDSSAQPGRPSDAPQDDAVDALVVELTPAGGAVSRAVVGRDGSVSAGSDPAISAVSAGGEPWRLTVSADLEALGGLGKNDLLRLCLVGYLESAAAPRTPSVVWPQGCDQTATRGAVVRIFEVAE